MKRRITRVTTRRGDKGKTSLADGSTVSKTDPRIEAIGAVDELNSFVGLLVSELGDSEHRRPCDQIQQELFDIGAHLATVGQTPCPDNGWLEEAVAALNGALPPLTEFVIPGGTRAASLAHVCRAACRRAERATWALGEDAVSASRYLNRLSDLFFVLARTCNLAGGDEPQWRGLQGKPPDVGE